MTMGPTMAHGTGMKKKEARAPRILLVGEK
jgi:hypothetical protein